MKRLLPLIALITVACSSEPDMSRERHGGPNIEEPPDYSAAIADERLRFQSDTLSLVFDDGGVLYSVEGNSYRFVELATNISVVFHPSEQVVRINGAVPRLTQCELIHTDGIREWYALRTSGAETDDIIVIEP